MLVPGIIRIAPRPILVAIRVSAVVVSAHERHVLLETAIVAAAKVEVPRHAGPAASSDADGAAVVAAHLVVVAEGRPDELLAHHVRQTQAHAVVGVRRADASQLAAVGQHHLVVKKRLAAGELKLGLAYVELENLALVPTDLAQEEKGGERSLSVEGAIWHVSKN